MILGDETIRVIKNHNGQSQKLHLKMTLLTNLNREGLILINQKLDHQVSKNNSRHKSKVA